MQVLEQNEVQQVGGGEFGPFTPYPQPDYVDPNVERFIEWKLMNPGYPYDQP